MFVQKNIRYLHSYGLTLIEILLVLALMGLLSTYAIPRLTQIARVSTRSGVRRFSALVKYCYDQSILTGKLHRINLDLTPGNQQWSLEVANNDALPEEKIKQDIAGVSSSSAKGKKPDTGFTALEGQSRMPKGITVVNVKSWRLPENESATKGLMAIYCFPNGFVDDALVAIQEEGHPKAPIFNVKTRSLTGRVDINVEPAKL